MKGSSNLRCLRTILAASENFNAQVASNLRPVKTELLVRLQLQYFFKAPRSKLQRVAKYDPVPIRIMKTAGQRAVSN